MFVPVCFIRHIGYSSRSAVATLRALPVEHLGSTSKARRAYKMVRRIVIVAALLTIGVTPGDSEPSSTGECGPC